MMKAKIKFVLMLSAGLALSACGSETASTSGASALTASASSSSITREAQPPSGSTKLCIQNIFSAITPVVRYIQTSGSSKEIYGEGPLAFGSTTCATGYDTNNAHVRGEITLPEPYTSLTFSADTPGVIGYKPYGALWQRADPGSNLPSARCIRPDGYSVGDRRTWDDGLLRYVMVREPDFEGNVFRLTIDRSQNPSADGKPARCPQ